jgi:hypothetical protein
LLWWSSLLRATLGMEVLFSFPPHLAAASIPHGAPDPVPKKSSVQQLCARAQNVFAPCEQSAIGLTRHNLYSRRSRSRTDHGTKIWTILIFASIRVINAIVD